MSQSTDHVSRYGTKAVVRFEFNGSAKGIGYLVGTPAFDAVRQRLSFPDLDYTIETRNLLLKIADWFNHEALRDDLRARLILDLSGPVGDARARLQRAMNQRLGAVQANGGVDLLRLLGFYADPNRGSFTTQLEADGNLSLSVP